MQDQDGKEMNDLIQLRLRPTAAVHRGPRLTRRRWFVLCAVGFGVLILTAVLRGSPEDAGWYVAHVAPSMAVVAVCTTRLGRIVCAVALVAYAVILPSMTVLAGLGVADVWNDGVRVKLFTDNPNLLGADLVAATIAAIVVRPNLPWTPWWPVAALAVVFTGSRTALMALGIAYALWLIVAPQASRTRVAACVGLACFVGIVAFAQWQLAREARLANLLGVSGTFDHEDWVMDGATVVVDRNVVSGPFTGSRADRIRGVAGQTRLIAYQIVERSVEGRPYTASVYLRAESPASLVLSSSFGRVACAVDEAWRRCVTPVGRGDGSTWALFRLEALEPGDRFDVFAYGPQYEAAEVPSEYAVRGATLFPRRVARRIASWSITADEGRVASMRAAIHAWQTAPYIGTGRRLVHVDERDSSEQGLGHRSGHAHNLILELLARDGIVGLVGWALITLPVLAYGLARTPRRLMPWLVALCVLNTIDMTIFHSGSYYSASIVVGIMWRASRTSSTGM